MIFLSLKKRFTRWISSFHAFSSAPRLKARANRPPSVVSMSYMLAEAEVFHTMEKLFGIFPHNGKNVSTVWKTRFRAVSGVLGCSLGAVERSTRRPLSTVERDRPRGREEWCPTKAGSALSRSRPGCGVGRDHFSGREVGDFRALRCDGGVACGADFNGGLLKIPRGLRDHAAKGRRPDPSPERVCAVGTVPGAVQSPRLAGRPPLSKWPRVSRVAGHSGRVAGGLKRLWRPFFGQN